MNDQTDPQLLHAYVERRSEPAFAELVRRHVDLVYSAALRMVCDSHLAQDVTQGVFVALAKNAAQLTDRPVLSGWLHRTAQNIAAQTVRTDVRRRAREQEAANMNELLSAEPDAVWKHIAPHLDAALDELSEPDRDALLLRYFERKSAREMAQTLGISDEAAQKRVNRAVERLREFFAKRGVTVGASGLVVVISANAVQAAPVGLAVTISTATAIAGTTLATTATATKAIAMTALQKTIIGATLAAAVGTGIYEARQASTLRTQVQTLQQQPAPLTEQIQQLQQERDDATSKLASLQDENDRSKSNSAELLRLRGEVGLLKQTAAALSNKLARASNSYGLLPEQMPPVSSSGVPDTAVAYARLVRKLAEGQLSTAEEFNLLKAWPYLERRFPEPDSFAYFQSEYLASMLNITNRDMVWEIRRLLETARAEEHAKGLRWARKSDEELQRYNIKLDIQKIREQWNVINQKTIQQILELLPEEQQSKLASPPWQVLDFDSRLKSGSQASLTDPRFQNLDPQEVFQSFFPPNPNVRLVPATRLETQ